MKVAPARTRATRWGAFTAPAVLGRLPELEGHGTSVQPRQLKSVISIFALAVAAAFLGRLPEGGMYIAGRDARQAWLSTALIAASCR
jgi:hypothetical protein